MMAFSQKRFFAARALLAAGLLLAAADAALPQGAAPEPLSAFPQSLLAVRTSSGNVVNFKIWEADTQKREEQGMMYIREMDEHTGMLFMFPENRPVTMWMKNTYVSLDLLFLNAQGKIDYIAARAIPKSEAIIGPPTPEFAVLELKGGACEQFGIKVGDKILHKNFKKQ
ncbi:MAG TPA: DUF192 domain-containing protein [Steroidobacteraceae bacterium]|jgi:uncharacterized membrane protein (UPF0127 family)|nr:DUF192 domain-containing protein [Steroidobacteraceae bacterium]